MKQLGKSAALLGNTNVSAYSDDISIIDNASPFPQGLDPRKVVIITESIEPQDVILTASSTGARHIIQKGHGDLELELAVASTLITDRKRFLENPLEVFKLQGKELKIPFTSSEQKEDVKKKLFEHIQPIPPLRTLADAVLLIADEMIMNAVYDAPGNTTRSKKALPDGKQAVMTLSYDSNRLIVACADPFGSIEDVKLMNRLQSCYAGDQIEDINMGSGGAGIGCRMMFDNSTAMYFAAIKGFKTLSCCLLPVNQSLKATMKIPKNLHIAI